MATLFIWRRNINANSGFGNGQLARSRDWLECWNRHLVVRKVGSLSNLGAFVISAGTYDAV
jgi:hypothetical protein